MYIRTKDGVYDTNKYHYEIEIDVLYEIVWDDPYTEYGVNGKYSRGKVIAQSENLDELCDCFVKIWCKRKVNPEVLVYDEQYEEEKENILLVYPKGNIAIYGAIWTSKGLIYVAKMNDNGELVLI